jgi:hypothetical protein
LPDAGPTCRAPCPAWRIALEAGTRWKVSGMGKLLLGMIAHINRVRLFVLAQIGLVAPSQPMWPSGPKGSGAQRACHRDCDRLSATADVHQRPAPVLRRAFEQGN